jgi:hypothetical protein
MAPPTPKACTGLPVPAAGSPLDVVVLIDGSRSTIDPPGEDLDGDGYVGRQHWMRSAGMMVQGSSDPDDSMLAAEVAAARSLIQAAASLQVRFALVLFAGEIAHYPASRSTLYAGLSNRRDELDGALLSIQRRIPSGNSDFAEGLEIALDVLEQTPAAPDARRLVFMLTDSGKPFTARERDRRSYDLDEYPALEGQIGRARRLGVRVHTFPINAGAVRNPTLLEGLARQTGGSYWPPRSAAELHCSLIQALS